MRRADRERGAALVLLLGITATLAVLATTAVLVLANQQHATVADRTRDQSFNYAEAGLDSAVMAVRTGTWPAANAAFAQSGLTAAYDATYPSGSGPALVVKVYDNQATVSEAITWDKGGPAAPSTPDGKLWVESLVTMNGKTTRLRQLVGQVNSTGTFLVPAAAIYSDGNVSFDSGGGNAFGVTAAGAPDTAKTAAIMAMGSFTGNWSTSLSPNGGAATLQVKTNGTVYNPKLGISPAVAGTGGVPSVRTVFTDANIATMTAEAKQGSPTTANANGTVASATLISQLQLNQGKTTDVGYDLVVNGNLDLKSGTANFRSLYVTGNLTVGSAGAMHATALYVGGSFTVSGTDKTQTCGPIYVAGNVSWNSNSSVQTTDYLDATKEPGPLYVAGSFSSAGGPFSHVLGPTFILGDVTFSGNNAAILCPLFVTNGAVQTSGSGNYGTQAQPMVLLCAQGATGSHDITMAGQGTFTGLLVNMNGRVILGNTGNAQLPNNFNFFVRGAVLSTGDVRFTNNGNVGYDPTTLSNLQVTAGTTTTNVVPGTWQELPAN